MPDNNHLSDGRFAPGNKAALGHGRARVRRTERVRDMQETVSPEKWRAIVEKSVRDALGVRIVVLVEGPDTGTQRVEDDPNSDGVERDRARRFLADYLIGRPIQPLEVETVDESVDELFSEFNSDELRTLLKLTEGVPAVEGSSPESSDSARTLETESGGSESPLSDGEDVPPME